MKYAIAFDLDYNDTVAFHPVGVRQAYHEIDATLSRYGFKRIQQSVFMSSESDLTSITFAMTALKALPWFSTCVKDIRAFRVEDWSDFTPFFETNR
jgi:virulence-associated protein VapD